MIKFNMERIFYPIGQGAFYAEKFKNEDGGVFNVVYDCGVGTNDNNPRGIQTVSNAFQQNETIDILFISHLDSDHVNMIPTLIKGRNIKNVILPLVKNDTFIINLFKIMNINGQYDTTIKILTNKQSFFEETNIIEVERLNESSQDILQETIDVNNLNQNIPSKTCIKTNLDWVYIPVNYDQSNLKNELNQKLKTHENIYWHNIDLTDDSQVKDIINDTDKRKELRNIYSKLKGNINLNSLVVYSGPKNENSWYLSYFEYGGNMFFFTDKPSCIFTGDTELKKMKIRSTFSSYYNLVGTIQVPHHGSEKNHDISQYDEYTICPISVGKNRYRHPSPYVIGDLKQKNCDVFCVTDNPNHFLKETIIKY